MAALTITFVKKIKADGTLCRKCADVEKRLVRAGLMGRVDRVIVADERQADGYGMQLAAKYGVKRAPFFVVRHENGAERVYTVYVKFVKEVLQAEASEEEQATELLEQNPDLSFI